MQLLDSIISIISYSYLFYTNIISQGQYFSFSVEFSELTKDTIFEGGQQLLLVCKIQNPVKECQWTWRPLDSKNTTELMVKTFKAFGNTSQDCSIRLNSVLPEQAGYWTCGAKDIEENFTRATSIKLTVRKPQEGEVNSHFKPGIFVHNDK